MKSMTDTPPITRAHITLDTTVKEGWRYSVSVEVQEATAALAIMNDTNFTRELERLLLESNEIGRQQRDANNRRDGYPVHGER
jgi:hypothetical protein